jgi:hypothetical protein
VESLDIKNGGGESNKWPREAGNKLKLPISKNFGDLLNLVIRAFLGFYVSCLEFFH